MFDLDLFIVAVYDQVTTYFRRCFPHGVRQRGFEPRLTDEEVITIGIVGEYLGFRHETEIFEYFRRHYQAWFPALTERPAFIRQLHNLWGVYFTLWQGILQDSGAWAAPWQFIDTLPVPICHRKRAASRSIFLGDLLLEPDEGYCPAKDWYYFGFKGGLRIAWNGMIVHSCLLPARPHDHEALTDLLTGTPAGTTVGADKGFIDRVQQQALQEAEQICLLTPRRKNMAPETPFQLQPVGNRFRRLLETVIGQLTERFNIQRLKVRKGWLLLAKWYRKIVAHTLCVWLNILNHRDPLDLEGLVTL